jgi:hypothetical protein
MNFNIHVQKCTYVVWKENKIYSCHILPHNNYVVLYFESMLKFRYLIANIYISQRKVTPNPFSLYTSINLNLKKHNIYKLSSIEISLMELLIIIINPKSILRYRDYRIQYFSSMWPFL